MIQETTALNSSPLTLQLGVKTDPIEYRYSYEWLFRLLAEEGVPHVQLGTFFELYLLPDAFFVDLRKLAADFGLTISSVFSAHRELGGLMRDEHPAWGEAARRAYRRMIEVGGLLGAEAVGASAGAVMRDRPAIKAAGLARYLAFMKEMMHYAHEQGVAYLTVEPMSALAEPPTLPEELQAMGEELFAYHRQHLTDTAGFGYCTDVAHGYADQDGNVVWDNMQLLQASLPYVHHIHLKNTDGLFNSTFGFAPAELERGIVDVVAVRDLLLAQAGVIPHRTLVGYLEIGGPKTGRDYSDWKLEGMLRESLRYLQSVFPTESVGVQR